MQSIQSFAE